MFLSCIAIVKIYSSHQRIYNIYFVNYDMKPLSIDSLKPKNPIFLAPMFEITDLPYRLLCREAGAAMAYTEMIFADAITHENTKTKQMMKTCKADSPLGIQITGNSEEEIKKTAPFLKKYDLVDINCGCPSDRIISNQSGSCLLQKPEKIARIIKILKKENFIVTAKIRLGFKTNTVLKTAKIIEKAGADAIAIHARLASQAYDIPAKPQWKWIAKVKQTTGIPIIGNGDIANGEDCKEMLEIADGAMVGRAAIGNPLIFRQILHYLKTGKDLEISAKQRIAQFQEYLKLSEKYSLIDLARAKHLGANFLKGFPGASQARNQIMHLGSPEEIKNLVKLVSQSL